jgi:hypothetical protein
MKIQEKLVNSTNPLGKIILLRNNYILEKISAKEYASGVYDLLRFSGIEVEDENELDTCVQLIEEIINKYGDQNQ